MLLKRVKSLRRDFSAFNSGCEVSVPEKILAAPETFRAVTGLFHATV